MLNNPFSSRLFQRGAAVPVGIFILLVALLVLLVRISNREPVINAVEPSTIDAGAAIEIRGRFFEDEGTVSIGSRRVSSDGVLNWTSNRIEVRTPADVASGLVYVETESGRSNGVFVSVSNDLPQLVSAELSAEAPSIDSISPSEAQVGDVVRITGRRFGSQRNGGRVTFRWTSGEPEEGAPREPISVSEFDYGYEFWSEREVAVRVPDGAVSGSVVVETNKGRSNPVPIDIVREVGSKTFQSPRSFALYYDVSVSGVTLASREGQNAQESAEAERSSEPRLYLWIPRVQTLPGQRDVQLLRRAGGAPLFSGTVPGLLLYELGPEELAGDTRIGRAYLFRRYAVSTAVIPQRVPTEYDMSARFMSRYTAASPDLPVGGEYAVATVRRLIGAGGNPYRKAEILYNYVLELLSPVPEIGNIPVAKGVEEREGNAFTYAALLTTLLREADVPSRMVAGAIFDGSSAAVRHYWSEFYIQGVGWVPADPALADGLHAERFESVENRRSYYFGNLDARRVAFSPGRLHSPKLSPYGAQVEVPEMYSLQRYYEERVGPIESYTSRWYSLILLGEYGG